MKKGSYEQYAAESLAAFRERDDARKKLLVDAAGIDVRRVLDLGCGAGQELVAFLENTSAVCVGVDYGEQLGAVTKTAFADQPRAVFVRAKGEELPFESGTFDVIVCRVALPYMNNRSAIAEMARVLRPGGKLLLKTHAPLFYFGMIADGVRSMNAKAVAYPLICLTAGIWHSLSGRQLQEGFWRGKEVFQTNGFLEREFEKNGLEIAGRLADDNRRTPSFEIVKRVALNLVVAASASAVA